jgi:hypothetical protein
VPVPLCESNSGIAAGLDQPAPTRALVYQDERGRFARDDDGLPVY